MSLLPRPWSAWFRRIRLCITCAACLGPFPAAAESFRLCAEAADEDSYDGSDFLMLRQGRDGWLFRDRADFRVLKPLDEDIRAGVEALAAALTQRGTNLVIVVPPTRGIAAAGEIDRADPAQAGFDVAAAVAAYHARLQEFRAAGAIVPDILAHDADLGADFFLRRDTHWSAEGARVAARAVAGALRDVPAYGVLPKRAFVTEAAGSEEAAERMGEAAEKMCDIEIEPQRANLYRTSPAGADAAALLADAPPPQVVLVGTSFSRRDDGDSNFTGFLEEALSADVLNAAVSGGGADASITAYLASAEFRKAPPKILIWEFPAYADLPEDMFPRALGALNGACPADRVVARSELAARKGKREAFSWEKGVMPSSEPFYLQIDVADAELRKFALRARDGKGKTRSVWFDASRLAPAALRQFFTNLPNDRGNGLRRIELDMKQGDGGQVTVTLCRRPDRPS